MFAKEFSAKSVDEAIKNALDYFCASKSDIGFQILEEPTRKLFGLVSKPARVFVYLKYECVAKNYLADVFATQNLKVDIVFEGDNIILSGEDAAKSIGKHGELLNALQTLTNAAVTFCHDKHYITIDALNYRERRRKTLVQLANSLAGKAVRTHSNINLEPMTPSDRRIIHETLAHNPKVNTFSKGNDPYRYVVIEPVSGG